MNVIYFLPIYSHTETFINYEQSFIALVGNDNIILFV